MGAGRGATECGVVPFATRLGAVALSVPTGYLYCGQWFG